MHTETNSHGCIQKMFMHIHWLATINKTYSLTYNSQLNNWHSLLKSMTTLCYKQKQKQKETTRKNIRK